MSDRVPPNGLRISCGRYARRSEFYGPLDGNSGRISSELVWSAPDTGMRWSERLRCPSTAKQEVRQISRGHDIVREAERWPPHRYARIGYQLIVKSIKDAVCRQTPRGSAAGDMPAHSEFYDPPRAGAPARTGALSGAPASCNRWLGRFQRFDVMTS